MLLTTGIGSQRLTWSLVMKRMALSSFVLCLCLQAGCKKAPQTSSSDPNQEQDAKQSLAEARRGFQTNLVKKVQRDESPPPPPPTLFQVVRYDAPVGKLAAYLSNAPRDGKKHPAIIWIFGGFDNDIGEPAWEEQSPKNDQSASAFRKAGIVMMYPALRGGHDNIGFQESFYGEVDDVLAAADFLAKQPFVDPARIYVGGHSTGGTLVLLAAACSDRFRAVFSFGPADDVVGYGSDSLHFDTSNDRELQLRAPGRWLHSMKNSVFVFEGTQQGNIDSLHKMAKASKNPQLHFHPVNGANHFSLLAPVTRLAASKILGDTGETCNIAFSEKEVSSVMGR